MYLGGNRRWVLLTEVLYAVRKYLKTEIKVLSN